MQEASPMCYHSGPSHIILKWINWNATAIPAVIGKLKRRCWGMCTRWGGGVAWDEWGAEKEVLDVNDLQAHNRKNILNMHVLPWSPARLLMLLLGPCSSFFLARHTFWSHSNKTFSYASIFSITINNRSSRLDPVIGPFRYYLRTKLSLAWQKSHE